MASPPHALVLPFPAQGHVIPLLELSHCLIDRGFEITFVNTEFNHDRIIAALSGTLSETESRVRLVSIPDGLAQGADRTDLRKLTDGFQTVMPRCLEDLIRKTNDSGTNPITCVIADQNMAWVFDIAKRMGIRSAAIFPGSAALLALFLSIPKLTDDGILSADGVVQKKEDIKLSQEMPPINPAYLSWNCMGDSETNRILFKYIVHIVGATEIADVIICNSFYELERPVFEYIPKILPVGPLRTALRFGKPVGNFWPEDPACMAWLDEQRPGSVVYVAFGSFTIFDRRQFQELALGLELTGLPFLWVAREDTTDQPEDAFPDGFRERIAGRGRVVGWSPQQQVLAHPSVACFVSHCGWNSTMEGVRNGVPFLCWPYFCDQFVNQDYICDVWSIGLRMVPNESGVISKEQIKSKVEKLLDDDEMKSRAASLKKLANESVEEGGNSFKNFNSFVEAMK